MSDGVASHRTLGIQHIVLDRPRQHNAVNTTMLAHLTSALSDAAADDEVRVIVITGAGQSFCAGGDLTGVDTDGAAEAANRVVTQLVGIPKPVVAGVRGAAAGLGCALALACDLVVAARTAFFQLAFTRVGLMPDGGTSAILTATLGRARASRMALLGERVDAATAADWGLISHLVEDSEYDEALRSVTDTLARGASAAYGRTKHALVTAALADLPRLQALESEGQRHLITTRDFRRAAADFRSGRQKARQP